MTPRHMLALLAVAAAAVLAAPVTAAQAPDAPRLTQATLGNGLRVAIVENHSAPVVRIGLRYRYGTNDDPPAVDGLAHALEHMMFRGTHALSGSGLDELQGRLGADTNADTGREDTQFYGMFPADRLEVELRIEADRMHGLLLRETDWASERQALLEEIREGDAKATGVLEDAVRARAYGYAGSSFAHTGGTANAMRAITVADLRRAYAAAYEPDNALLVIAGDVRPGAALSLVRRIFGPLRGHARVAHTAEPTPRRGFTLRLAGGTRTLIDVALESFGAARAVHNGEPIAAELLSPDHTALRDLLVDNGPCDSYVVDDDTELHGGMYHLICTVGFDSSAARAVTAIRTALRMLAAHPPPGAIGRARRSYIDATAFQCDDLAAEADLFGVSLSQLDAAPGSLDRAAARISDAQVQAVLRRWTVPLAVAVSTRTQPRSTAVADKRTRSEKPAPARGDEPVVQPGWARSGLDVSPQLATAPAEAFALANGVRVFVDRHPGNGTVYLRAGIDDPLAFRSLRLRRWEGFAEYLLASGTRRWPNERVAAVAEQHEMKVDIGTQSSAQGFARDLPIMLDIVADAWRAPRDIRVPASRDFLAVTERPERFWIAITGDVDPAAVRTIVERDFGGWRAPPEPSRSFAPGPRAESKYSPGIHALPGARATVQVAMLLPAPRPDEPDTDAATLLNEILGAGEDFDTRLMHELRTRRGFAYGATSFYDRRTDGHVIIYFECAPRDLAAARATVFAVLAGMRAHPPTAGELARARLKLAVAALLARTTADGRLDALAAARTHGVPDDPQQFLQRLSAVTPADAARVAHTYFRRDRLIELDNFSR